MNVVIIAAWGFHFVTAATAMQLHQLALAGRDNKARILLLYVAGAVSTFIPW